MKILAIDTSCDETCAAVLEEKNGKIKIKSNVVSSQIKVHKKYGGVVPGLAKREHEKNLTKVLEESLKKAGLLKKDKKNKKSFKEIDKILEREKELLKLTKKFLKDYKKPDIDFIAVTKGPGLEPCLWTGINFAKALSFFWEKPIIPVNHLKGHILVNLLEKKEIKFPAIALVASGGHTELVFIKDIKNYKLLGETRDDAAGECLDKVAKIINLPYPGGPEIEKLAKIGNPKAYSLPRPMITSKDYDFSFSGLKTAVLYLTKKIGKRKLKSKKTKSDIAASSQQAIIDVLISKTIKAAKDKKAKTILFGGGVVANKELRKQMKKKMKMELPKINYIEPKVSLSTDNAVMIGITGLLSKKKMIPFKNLSKIKAKANINF
ncbi:MAG: tRNA (adenosine(37)-N6)-threonylcarbamoyltransferase complex transferase subunit TsaD [Candidatus Pacebacteria bacterium]|nr:tRNA (adenosine(37)-N6)-threonylcarbamoyltransferase complex transferase subunit TsaD [Candidatus Paceibacterota bacterium]